jgi:hypothetical protein
MTQRVVVAYDPRIERRHVRLAVIWLAILLAIAAVGLVAEYIVINDSITQLTSALLRHFMQNQPSAP